MACNLAQNSKWTREAEINTVGVGCVEQAGYLHKHPWSTKIVKISKTAGKEMKYKCRQKGKIKPLDQTC